MASGIQQGIASKYYSMAEDATTPDQINQVRQLLAKTIQNGGLPAYEGIPIVEQLNGKYQAALQQAAMAGQTKAGLIPPTSEPMAQEILAQAQQPEEEDSGIDELASNLPTEEYAEGGIVGFAGGGDAYSEAYERIFGKKDKTPGGPSASTSSKGVNIPSMTGAGRPSVPIIGPPPGQIGAIPSIENLGASKTANEKGIGKLIPNFSGPASSSSFLSKIGKRLPVIGGYLTAAEVANLGIQGLVDSDKGTASEFLDPIAAMQGTSGGTDKGKPQLDGSTPARNVPTPDAIPPNVQTVLDQYKNSKKLGDTPISNKPNAPAKAPAAPVVREEMGPPRDLMAAEAPVVDTTPKEDAISKYEKMLTQPPEQRKKERDLDFYTRLFQAGIGVASGSSRNALENLKEAQPAIAGFASDIAKQREDDRNRIKDLASLGLKREEFAMELKKLGISEKQVAAISKHYDDYFKLGQEKNRITEQHYKDVAKNYGIAAGTAGNKLAQTLTIAQDRNIKDLIKGYQNNPKYMAASPAELRALAMQSLGYNAGPGMAGPAPITWNNLIAPTK
jgi:hypothetical protein